MVKDRRGTRTRGPRHVLAATNASLGLATEQSVAILAAKEETKT